MDEKNIPANIQAMIDALGNVDQWLEQDKTNHQAFAVLSDGTSYVFLLVNSHELAANINYPLIDEPRAMYRFLALSECAEDIKQHLCEDEKYNKHFMEIFREECMGVEPEKDDMHFYGRIEDDSPEQKETND